MGSWGTGIFQDDFAADLRDAYNELCSLGFDQSDILKELLEEFGRAQGIDQSTFWIAVAMLQHKTGELVNDVKKQACELINSGRALNDWRHLVGDDDKSVCKRRKELEKAKAKILSPLGPHKRPRTSSQLKKRINKTYQSYGWIKDNLYAFKKSSNDYVVICACDAHKRKLERHYSKIGSKYVQLPRPILLEPSLLLLNYRKPVLPSAAELLALQPAVRSFSEKEMKDCLEVVEKSRIGYQEGLAESFASYKEKFKKIDPSLADDEIKRRCTNWHNTCEHNLLISEDRESAATRFFYKRFMIDPREAVPTERLLDLT